MADLNWSFFCEISFQVKVVNNFDKKLHFKIYHGILNLPRVFFSDSHFTCSSFIGLPSTSTVQFFLV